MFKLNNAKNEIEVDRQTITVKTDEDDVEETGNPVCNSLGATVCDSCGSHQTVIYPYCHCHVCTSLRAAALQSEEKPTRHPEPYLPALLITLFFLMFFFISGFVAYVAYGQGHEAGWFKKGLEQSSRLDWSIKNTTKQNFEFYYTNILRMIV